MTERSKGLASPPVLAGALPARQVEEKSEAAT
jgi:hypothetical protein